MFTLRSLRYLTILAAILLIVAVFLPWVTIESIKLSITGMNTEGTDFGKPGYFHLAMAALFLIFSFTPRIWAKRINLLIVALNLAWAIRNFIMIAACSGGECPTRELGIWIVLLASVIMLLGALFPDVDLEKMRR
jgi:hypothetical protein